MKYELLITSKMKKDVRRCKKRGLDLDKLKTITDGKTVRRRRQSPGRVRDVHPDWTPTPIGGTYEITADGTLGEKSDSGE